MDKNSNFISVISIEGSQAETGSRRGIGVYEHVGRLKDALDSRFSRKIRDNHSKLKETR